MARWACRWWGCVTARRTHTLTHPHTHTLTHSHTHTLTHSHTHTLTLLAGLAGAWRDGYPPGGGARWRGASRHPIGEEFQFKTSGDEVDYKNASLLLTKIMLCRKLRCQKVSLNKGYRNAGEERAEAFGQR